MSDHSSPEAAHDADTEESTVETDRYWGRPLDARRWHIFDGLRSLCGNWSMTNKRGDKEAVDPESDTFRDGEDCKACCRKAGVLDD